MSIIAQARLTPLSQKCLSIVAWRYDIHVKFGYFQNYKYQELTKYTRKILTGINCDLNADRQSSIYQCGIYKLKEYNTPKLCRKRNTVLDKILVKEFMREFNDPNIVMPINKDTHCQFTNIFKESMITKFNNKTTKNYKNLSQLYKNITYLLKNGRNRYQYINCNPFMSRESIRISNLALLHESHSDNNYNDDKDFREFDPKSFVSMLSILGLYRGMTGGDIEEEKAKLSDEQKVEKMKPAELLIAKGILSMCDQDYAKANELFHEALYIAQDENNEGQETLVLNLLACNSFESGNLKDAEKLFIELMKRMIAHDVEPTDLAILELSLKLASIYSKDHTTHAKAMKGFEFVINSLLVNLQEMLNNVDELEIHEISEDKKDELALLGWSYDWLAKHLITVNDYCEAVSMLQRALKISSKVLGPLHDQTLILLNDVGTTMAINDEPEEGKIFIKKAVEGAIESESRELASFYVNLGLVNLQLKKLSEAKRYCEYSIELALKNREHHNSNEIIQLSRNCLNEVERLLDVNKQ